MKESKYRTTAVTIMLSFAFVLMSMVSACGGDKSGKVRESDVADSRIVAAVENERSGESDNQEEQALEKSPATTAGSTVMTSDLIPVNGKPVIIDFSATWCGPCQRMKPVFAELKDTYDDYINFVTIDIDEYQQIAEAYGITAVPTFVFLDKNGKEVNRIEGAVNQSVIENAINKVI